MLNKVILIGRLTKTPELRHTQSGIPLAVFTLAVERDYKDSNGERQTDFFNCTAWRATGEYAAKYCTKGDMIAITGRLETRKYTDKAGNNRTATEIRVESVSSCGGKRAENASTSNVADGNEVPRAQAFDIDDDEDVPF